MRTEELYELIADLSKENMELRKLLERAKKNKDFVWDMYIREKGEACDGVRDLRRED